MQYLLGQSYFFLSAILNNRKFIETRHHTFVCTFVCLFVKCAQKTQHQVFHMLLINTKKLSIFFVYIIAFLFHHNLVISEILCS